VGCSGETVAKERLMEVEEVVTGRLQTAPSTHVLGSKRKRGWLLGL
jgi:hypothetical protein